jgi:hypothetical protein
MQWPRRESRMRAASLAGLQYDDRMQDWPIEVADSERLAEFMELLEAHRGDWELTFLFLDLVLQSACSRADLKVLAPTVVDVVALAVDATRAPSLMENLEYWACADSSPDEAFEVSPIVREALLRLSCATF